MIRKVGTLATTVREAYKHTKQPFRFEVIERVIDATLQEVTNLTTDPYHQNLSLENNFIIRAGGIFSQASRVYAISIDELSTFWVSDEQRQRAQ